MTKFKIKQKYNCYHTIILTLQLSLIKYELPHPANLFRAGGTGGPVTAEVVDIVMMLTSTQFCTLSLRLSTCLLS